MQEPGFNSWVRKIPWRRDRLATPVFLGFSGGSDGKESTRNAGDLGSIPGLGRSPGGGHGNPLQYSGLEYHHEQKSLAGYSPWGHKESATTERLSTVRSSGYQTWTLVWATCWAFGKDFFLGPSHWKFWSNKIRVEPWNLYFWSFSR